MSSDDTTYTLAHPIKHGSETIKTVTLRPAIAKDLDDLPFGKHPTYGQMRLICARLAGHPPTAFDTMHPEDLVELFTRAGQQMGESPATGESS